MLLPTDTRYPNQYVEKQVLVVALPDAFLIESDHAAIPHTHCEVFAPRGIMTYVCDACTCLALMRLQIVNYFPGTATELVAVDEDVLSLLTPMSENYFHFVAEFLPRHVPCRPGTSIT